MLESPNVVEPGLPGTRFGSLRRFAEIDSTNRYLMAAALQGAPEGTVAVADYQSAGRGRLERRWEAPPGTNLLCSVLLRPALALEDLALCTVAMALAAGDACVKTSGVLPDLKWPNDLLVGESKLAGILAEIGPSATRLSSATRLASATKQSVVVIGLGLNVRWPTLTSPTVGSPSVGASVPATSLVSESGVDVDLRVLLMTVLSGLEDRLRQLEGDVEARARQVDEYRSRCVTLGRRVRVEMTDRTVTGRAVGIASDGRLVVDLGDRQMVVTAGDVVHLRADP